MRIPRSCWSVPLLLAAMTLVHARPAAGQSGGESSALEARSDAARAGVEQTNRAFIAAFKAGDAAAATALYAPNAVVVEEDGARSEGRAKIGAVLKQYTTLFSYPAFDVTIESFGSSGNVAWAAGKETGTFADKKTKKSTSMTVTYLAVYERQADDKWLLRYLQESPAPKASSK